MSRLYSSTHYATLYRSKLLRFASSSRPKGGTSAAITPYRTRRRKRKKTINPEGERDARGETRFRGDAKRRHATCNDHGSLETDSSRGELRLRRATSISSRGNYLPPPHLVFCTVGRPLVTRRVLTATTCCVVCLGCSRSLARCVEEARWTGEPREVSFHELRSSVRADRSCSPLTKLAIVCSLFTMRLSIKQA